MEYISITNWIQISEFGKNIVSIGAVIIGGWWSYKKFFREAEDEASIDVKLECRSVKTEIENIHLLTIKAQLHNNGNVPSLINLEKSRVIINKLNPTARTEELYMECENLKNYGSYNIPVKGNWDALDFALIEHPGIYHVSVEFSLSSKDTKRFISRRYEGKEKISLKDWISNLLGKRKDELLMECGWMAECIISSEIESALK